MPADTEQLTSVRGTAAWNVGDARPIKCSWLGLQCKSSPGIVTSDSFCARSFLASCKLIKRAHCKGNKNTPMLFSQLMLQEMKCPCSILLECERKVTAALLSSLGEVCLVEPGQRILRPVLFLLVLQFPSGVQAPSSPQLQHRRYDEEKKGWILWIPSSCHKYIYRSRCTVTVPPILRINTAQSPLCKCLPTVQPAPLVASSKHNK